MTGVRRSPRRAWTGIALLLLQIGFPHGASAAFPPFEAIRAKYAPTEAMLLDRHGRPLQERRADASTRRVDWVQLENVSEVLRNAVLASEDRRFEQHSGVDWLALAHSAVKVALGDRSRGASTVSMQLATLLANDLVPRKGRRGVEEKIKQISEARALEREWTKSQILEAYLNLVSFRGELQGVASASHGLMGKAPHGLSEGEAVVLASLIRAPGARSERVETRACALADALERPSACLEAKRILAAGALSNYHIVPRFQAAPHAADLLLARGITRSTLDADAQAAASGSLARHLLAIRDRNAHDGAVLAVDNFTGEVRVYVGGVDRLATARFVDGVRARRQAGSTLKPFLYLDAISRGYLTASSPLEDSSEDIALATGAVYRPRNYDQLFHGSDVTLRSALGSSLNVPAVRALKLLGVAEFTRTLGRVGMTGLLEPEFYGPSLALGSADITLWDLVNSYRTLARGGVRGDLRLSPDERVKPDRRVFPETAAFIISDILSDRSARALGFGFENPLALPFWAAAKTGTSKDMRDNWCVGYSRRYTVGVWVGNSSGEPMRDVSGISGAAPVWAEVMTYLHRTTPSAPPKAPRGIVRSGSEWYLAGTEPKPGLPKRISQELAGMLPTRIAYPPNGMIVARDPDIPLDRQRLVVKARPERAGLRWSMNGKALTADELGSGIPVDRPGVFEVTLADAQGGALDSVKFTVRGGSPSENALGAEDVEPAVPDSALQSAAVVE